MSQASAVLACCLVVGGAAAPSPAESQDRPVQGSEWSHGKAADYLDERQSWWLAWPNAQRDHDTSCISCHTSLPYALARPALRSALGESGPGDLESRLLEGVRKRVMLWNEVEPFYPDQTVGLPKTSESRGTEAVLNTVILAAHDARAGNLTDETRRAFENLWRLQFTRGEQTGAWAWLHFDLAPWESESAEYFGAALGAVAVGVAPEDYQASDDIAERLALLRTYLLRDAESRPPLDQVMLLWASAELHDLLAGTQAQSIITDVLRLQNPDGGWSLASLGPWKRRDGSDPDRRSDGYATGLVSFVLLRAGVAPRQHDLSRALSWLVQNQDGASGRWPASSLNRERDPQSDRGLFMSDAATAFAVLALTEALSASP